MPTYNKPFYIVVSPVASKFAKALQKALQEKVVNTVYRRLTPKQGRSCFVVTQRPLNKVEQLRQFVAAGVSCPKWSTDPNAITRGELGKVVFARTLINSTNGRGILEIDLEDTNDIIPRAPLYTEYIPKKSEYRFHVFNGKVIDIQQKKKKREFDENDRNTRIRNLHNGYIYSRDDINPPDGAADLAIRAVAALGYQYGAVDLVYNEKRNCSYVLECNSRPGLMGSTLESYAEALINTYQLKRKL